MIFRRFAFAIGLLAAALASQLPEYTQQYRQRIGGAIDELSGLIATFDGEAAAQSVNREQAIAHLRASPDPLVQGRGLDMADTVTRRDRLQLQKDAFVAAGPFSQYAVLAEDVDPGVARRALADFQPAVPVTLAGFAAGAVGLVLGWMLTHALAWPIRRRVPRRVPATTAV